MVFNLNNRSGENSIETSLCGEYGFIEQETEFFVNRTIMHKTAYFIKFKFNHSQDERECLI